MDFTGPLHGLHFLVIIDAFFEGIEGIYTKTPNSTFVIISLQNCFFFKFRVVEVIVSGNGTQFNSEQSNVF